MAGIRDWIVPSFFSISRHHADSIDVTIELLAGALFILDALRKQGRLQRT